MPKLLALSRLLRFVIERENLRIRKASGHPGPWTTDPILAKYRFCNIRRRDDRVSQWLLTNYYPYTAKGADAWFPALVARYINWPPTLRLLLDSGVGLAEGEVWNPHAFESVIAQLKFAKEKIYTGAYMIYPGSSFGNTVAANKEQFLTGAVFAGARNNSRLIRSAIENQSIKLTVSELAKGYGVSTFMAGQAVADLTYLPTLNEAKDLFTYAPIGPGSIRGLNRLYGYDLKTTWKSDEFCSALIDVRNNIVNQLQISDLTLHDCQNIMCEFDKYERVRNKEGRPRSTYRPETAYV